MTELIHIQHSDDLDTLRGHLRRARSQRIILFLPWDTRLLSRPLDFEILRREAARLGVEVSIVSPDPDLRALARAEGMAVFADAEVAEATPTWPRPRSRPPVEPPARPWWEEERAPRPRPKRSLPHWATRARSGVRMTVLVLTVLTVLLASAIVGPQATITLAPVGETLQIIVPVSADMEVETPDVAAGLIPARRVGDWFAGYIEVETTGTAAFQFGRATGTVLFTNLLPQDVAVPARTVVRTSAGSFAVRFATTQEVTVPALGQVPAPVEALEEGPAGNVGVNQINQVEGVAALALRVTNPEPTSGGSLQEVRAVSQDDMDRARQLLTAQLLDEAYEGLQAYLEPTELLPRQSLSIQAAETAFDRFVTERADTVGLQMRLLITGLAVDQDNAETVAYATLAAQLPDGYELVEAEFEIGEVAEEPLGSGDLTLFVTTSGYVAARLDPEAVRRMALRQPPGRAAERLEAALPLAEPPEIVVWPEWFPLLPVLPLHITVHVVPGE